MPDSPPPTSILDARLAEIDRRLGRIQTGLVDDEVEAATPLEAPSSPILPPRVPVVLDDPGAGIREEARPTPAARAPAPPEAAALIARLRDLAGEHGRLLESLRELVSAYERALAPPDPATTVRELTVSAGPLASTEALHGFKRTLSRIPEVRRVEVRGYEGGDRAIVDVHLSDPTS